MTDDVTTPITLPPRAPALILMGRDEQGKPHASSFAEEELELALKAAELMGLHHLMIGDDQTARALAHKLPPGRIFSSGKGFVPFVSKTTYAELCALAGVPTDAPPPSKPGKVAPAASTEQEVEVPPDLPVTWAAIRVGSLVAATTGPQEGWFEALVVEALPDDLFLLRWRDWSDEPTFARQREQIALLPQNLAVHG